MARRRDGSRYSRRSPSQDRRFFLRLSPLWPLLLQDDPNTLTMTYGEIEWHTTDFKAGDGAVLPLNLSLRPSLSVVKLASLVRALNSPFADCLVC